MRDRELYLRVRAEMLEADPDVVVDMMRLSSRELVLAFPEKIQEYIDNEFYEEEEPSLEEGYYDGHDLE